MVRTDRPRICTSKGPSARARVADASIRSAEATNGGHEAWPEIVLASDRTGLKTLIASQISRSLVSHESNAVATFPETKGDRHEGMQITSGAGGSQNQNICHTESSIVECGWKGVSGARYDRRTRP